MGRSSRRNPIRASKIAVHESRRELQRTRAKLQKERDMYMMTTTALVMSLGGAVDITPDMIKGIQIDTQVSVVAQDGTIRVTVTTPEPATEAELLEMRDAAPLAPAV